MANRNLVREAIILLPIRKDNSCALNSQGRCLAARRGRTQNPSFADTEGFCHADGQAAPGCDKYFPEPPQIPILQK